MDRPRSHPGSVSSMQWRSFTLEFVLYHGSLSLLPLLLSALVGRCGVVIVTIAVVVVSSCGASLSPLSLSALVVVGCRIVVLVVISTCHQQWWQWLLHQHWS
ncbi:hypothetical protein J3A83DRAFT_4211428 [Scleroderma citrinum]